MTGTSKKTIAIVNGTGRQAASLIRVASALGYAVRAQVHTRDGVVAEELAELPNVTLIEGPLAGNDGLIKELFTGAQLAFINTTYLAGDEVAIGRALADAAKRSGTIQHYVYSSMPDHSIHSPRWPALPLWSGKFAVENYVRQLGMPATFVYAGIYNNNFTSLPYPLFCMELLEDDSFEWRAPFHPDLKIPWLDAEHDVGPAVIQIFKDGPNKWNGHRIALAFELMSPRQVCQAFSRGLSRPCRYVCDPKIEVRVPIPAGYQEQLDAIEVLFGKLQAPFYPGFHPVSIDKLSDMQTGKPIRRDSKSRSEGDVAEVRGSAAKKISPGLRAAATQPPGSPSSSISEGEPGDLTAEARSLWEGWRGMEEYAREVFPIEEENNGLDWMLETPNT